MLLKQSKQAHHLLQHANTCATVTHELREKKFHMNLQLYKSIYRENFKQHLQKTSCKIQTFCKARERRGIPNTRICGISGQGPRDHGRSTERRKLSLLQLLPHLQRHRQQIACRRLSSPWYPTEGAAQPPCHRKWHAYAQDNFWLVKWASIYCIYACFLCCLCTHLRLHTAKLFSLSSNLIKKSAVLALA